MPKKVEELNLGPSKRLLKEYELLREDLTLPALYDLNAEDETLLLWTATLLPDNPPYNKGAFKIEVNFTDKYPWKPPQILMKTKIYHPNIDEKGQVCLAIILVENWKPTIRMEAVLQTLLALINDPVPENAIRPDLAEQLVRDKKKFMRIAEDYTRKYSETRPTEYEMAKMVKKKIKLAKDKEKKF